VKIHFQQAFRALILLSFAIFLFKLHFTGDITKFINPKYVRLSQSASLIFLVLFFIQITRIWTTKNLDHSHCHHEDHDCGHDHGNSQFNAKKLASYTIVILPLISGFFLPAKVLDASIASKKGGMAVLSNQSELKTINDNGITDNFDQNPAVVNSDNQSDQLLIDSQQEISKDEFNQLIQKLEQSPTIKMNDFVYNTYYEEISKDIGKYKGRKIQLTGFVYKEEGFQPNQLVLSRFLITHCVADASIVGFLSEFNEASVIDEDTWIEATGELEITTYDGFELPYLKITEWKEIREPKEPYIYPITIKIL
jgi:putative membrane protein